MKKNGGAPPPAVVPGVTLPEARKKDETEEKREEESEGEDDVEVVEQETTEELEEKKHEEGQTVWEAAAETEQEDDDESLTLDDIDFDTTRLSKIDLHAVFSLPPHLQKDMVQKILRDRRQEVRDQFIPLAGNPEKYSHTQISAFLQTSELNRRIEAAKRQKREEEMEKQGGVGMGPGNRIDSNSNRFYIYQKDAEREKEEEKQEVDEEVAEVEQTGRVERAAVAEATPSTDKPANSWEAAARTPLSEFASGKAGFIPDARATEVTAAWVARHQVRVKQEPVLAIEKLRLARLTNGAPQSPAKAPPSAQPAMKEVSVSLNLDEMAELHRLFPASKAEPVLDDADDGVDWEEVAAPATEMSPEKAEQRVSNQPVKKAVVVIESSANTPPADAKQAGDEKAGSDEELEWEDVPADAASPEQSLTSTAADVDLVEGFKSGPEEEEQRTDELFLTLKNEMEDAKAHEDLDLLKDEAIQSAMATASNLTQWAAGAVKRALQAHSLQHGGKGLEPHGSPDRTPVARATAAKGTAEAPLELSDGEDEVQTVPDAKRADVVVIADEEDKPSDVEADGSRDQLQAALAASIASEMAEAKTSSTRVRYLQYSQPSEPSEPGVATDTAEPEMDAAALRKEQLELKKLRGRQLRDTEGLTDDMVAEVMALLRLFGVPFLVSPMEAEAQCAALEQLGLVDGVITDDSDIFPFGGQRVYKNIFHHHKFVEAFSARDIERELGFSREQVIALALLLGSDYTDGVRGIGIVNATEIAAAYPGLEGLREFKEWVREFDVAEEATRVASAASKKKKSKKRAKGGSDGESEEGSDEDDEDSVRERFQRSHASARRKWELGDEFPSRQVVQAYMAPQVDRSDARFSWSPPDLAALRNYCANAFGWDQQKSDGVLQPLEGKAKAAAASGGRHIQTRLDRFFTSYDDQVHYAKIQSKRLRSAVGKSKSGTSKKQRQ
jgi:hypothetical protein